MIRPVQWACLVALLAATAWAVSTVFDLRLASGAIYPPYSSLRADPLGTKGLYESLERLPEMEVRRQFRHPRHLPEGKGRGLWVIGLPAWELNGSEEEVRSIERFVRTGGRLVVALSGSSFASLQWNLSRRGTNVPPPGTGVGPASQSGEDPSVVDLGARWGFQLRDVDDKTTPPLGAGLNAICDPLFLPVPALAWHSPASFVSLSSEWHSVAQIGTNTVLMERSLGNGTVVLASDCYLLSNEALRLHRATEFLSWLVSDGQSIWFNETHLGIQENPGVMTLVHRYRLTPFLWACLGVAFLFIWQSAASFNASTEIEAKGSVAVRGRDSVSGLVGLLRRNLPATELLSCCVREWSRSGHGNRTVAPERLVTVQQIIDRENALPARGRNVLTVYRDITQALALPGHKATCDSKQPSATSSQT